MYTVIAEAGLIEEAQNQLRQRVIRESDHQLTIFAGFQGGALNQPTYWFENFKFWACGLVRYTSTTERQRYWNAFGIGRPKAGGIHSFTVEVNSPIVGIDRRIAGAFVTDAEVNIFLAHRGRIGGGKPGVGKTLFESKFRDNWVDVDDGGHINRMVVIGRIGADDFIAALGQFVHDVAGLKAQI